MKKCLVIILIFLGVFAVASAEYTITDDFSDMDYSSNPVWTYEGGTEPTAEAGFLYVPTTPGVNGGTQVNLTFPEATGHADVAMACEVSFDILHAVTVSEGLSYEVMVELRNTQINLPWGKAYQFYCSTDPNAYFNTSGFKIYAEDGLWSNWIAGREEYGLSPIGGVISRIKFIFNPVTGCKVYKNGIEVGSFSNFGNVTEMTRFSFWPMTDGPYWRIDNVNVVYGIVTCGGTQLKGDLNEDCYVDMNDLAIFVLDWLKCSDSLDDACTGN